MSNIIKPENNLIIPISPKDLPKPFTQDIYLFTTHIAGTTHVDNIDDIMLKIKVDDEVLFYRETNNIHDKYAIVVKNINKEKMGYIPRDDNAIFARLMDAGKLLVGKITNIDQLDNWHKVIINIYLRNI